MTADLDRLPAERAHFAEYLKALDHDRDEPTRCEGWRVRDVVAHHSRGPTVRGPAGAIPLGPDGRPAAFDQLDGNGVVGLRSR